MILFSLPSHARLAGALMSLGRRLPSLGVTRIYCTDTVPLPERAAAAGVMILSVAGIIAERLPAVLQEAAA